MDRKGETISCSVMPQKVCGVEQLHDCPVRFSHSWGCWEKCCLVICSTTLTLVGFSFPWAQLPPFYPLRFSHASFLSGIQDLSSHLHPHSLVTAGCFSIQQQGHGTQINESHSRFLPARKRQRTPDNQSLHSHCVCEF